MQIVYKQYFFRIGCEFQNGCPNGACRVNDVERDCDGENGTDTDNDPQILRHLVFLILLLCSMFIVRKLLLSLIIRHYKDAKSTLTYYRVYRYLWEH